MRLVQFLAGIAAGILIGFFLSMKYIDNIWWRVLCVAAGGLSGYILVAPMAFLRAIPRAFSKAWQDMYQGWMSYFQRLKGKKKYVLMNIAHSFGLLFSWLVLLSFAITCLPNASLKVGLWFLGVSFIACLLWFISGMNFVANKSSKYDLHDLDESFDGCKEELRKANVLRVMLWLVPKFFLWQLPKALLWLVFLFMPWCIFKAVTFIFTMTIRFFWNLFVQVHSHKRLLALVWAAVGLSVGQHHQHPLPGLAIGLICAAVSYELIAKRWLKVVPNGNNTSA